MACKRAPSENRLPLLGWPEQAKIDALEEKRIELHDSIVTLPKMAHRRIVLEARLAELTAQQLELENSVGGKV